MIEEIQRLKEENKALILAHYYQPIEIQEIADFIGDSLELAKKAKETKAEMIIFCGVAFMAETAKILSPEKTVIHPVADAGCPMADMATFDALKSMKEKYPEAAVVTYVNSTAEVKSLSDICCTSSNAIDVVDSLQEEQVIFVPDKNLGAFVGAQLDHKEMILWDGFCYVHGLLQAESVKKMQNEYPEAVTIAHPECSPEVLKTANFVGSTSKLLSFVKETNYSNYIVLTESGIEYVLKRDHPSKTFLFPDDALYCRNMKKNSLQDVLASLKGQRSEVIVDTEIAKGALKALEAMFNV